MENDYGEIMEIKNIEFSLGALNLSADFELGAINVRYKATK